MIIYFPINIRLKIHRKDVKDSKAILIDKGLLKSDRIFKEHARFTIIDKLTKSYENVFFREKTSGYKNWKIFS